MTLYAPISSKQQTTPLATGIATNLHNVQAPVMNGVPMSPLNSFCIIPINKDDGRCTICQNVPITPNVPLTLREDNTTEYNGKTCFVADCERGIRFSFDVQATQTVNILIFGYDYRGMAISEITQTTIGSFFANSEKQYSYVYSIIFSANPGVSITQVSCSDEIGFPHLVYQSSIVSASWNKQNVTSTAVTEGGYDWRNGAAPPSLNTGTTRGYISLPSASDSVKMLFVVYYMYGEDSLLNTQVQNEAQLYQKNQLDPECVTSTLSQLTYLGVETVENSTRFIMPTVMTYDLVGVQFPGDLPFIAEYEAIYTNTYPFQGAN